MRKFLMKFSLLTAVTLSFSSCAKDIPMTHTEELRLAGNVKTLLHSKFKDEAAANENDPNPSEVYMYEFDSNGYITTISVKDSDGKGSEIRSYTNGLHSGSKFCDNFGKEQSRRKFKNDGKRVTSGITYDANGHPLEFITYSYGRNKKVQSVANTHGIFIEENDNQWKRDKAGNISEIRLFYAGRYYDQSQIFTFVDGSIVKEATVKRLRQAGNMDVLLDQTLLYEYDDTGILSGGVFADNLNETEYRVVFQCDDRGNWIRKSIYNENDSVTGIEQRIFEYY